MAQLPPCPANVPPCHLPAWHGSPGLGKTGASLQSSLATEGLGFGCNLLCLYHPFEPQCGFEGEFISSVWAEVSVAALVLIPLTRQQPHQLQSHHSICTAPAFNANGWWLATRQFLSQVWNLLFHRVGWNCKGRGKCFIISPLIPFLRYLTINHLQNTSFEMVLIFLWEKKKPTLLKSKLCCQNRPF